jgi:hypothetical protein
MTHRLGQLALVITPLITAKLVDRRNRWADSSGACPRTVMVEVALHR